jgi:hypothetical protein
MEQYRDFLTPSSVAREELVQEKFFKNKLKFSKEVSELFGNGIVFSTVVEGICHMRPEIMPVTNCVMYVKHLNFESGEIGYFKFVFEEEVYDMLPIGGEVS